ncbi:phage portal protein, HK97 family [Kaistia soli DSM 19436]|uniref:Phage portal protein, HK97 family n=1 Tax=Kaistia soli DSM 19436 TaxID=1122133 RepID=A0A1M5PQZ2_9HYPH|nr:phage portal protein, HK97 family [Kaistia soli DSM 19436]
MLASWISKAGGFIRGGVLEKKSLVSGVSSPAPWFLDLIGSQPVASGVSVTPETAMRSAAVRCAVQAIAEAVGQLPVIVYSRDPAGAKERDTSHPLYEILHDAPNTWQSASSFKEQVTRDALLHGNGYGYISRAFDGRPIELQRLDPRSVTVDQDDFGAPLYFISTQAGRRQLDRGSILHISAPSLDGVSGASPVILAKETIGVLIALEAHTARLFGNGARPSLAVLLDEDPGEGALEKIVASWKAAHGGSRQGGTAVLQGVKAIESLTMNSVDSQLLQIWAYLISDIARVFRVPPVLLMDYSRQTWANAEFGGQQFLTYTLARWLKAWEGEIRLKLFAPDERQSSFAEFLIDDLLRADFGARAESYAKLISARVLSPNEARAMENRAPYAGGDQFMNPNTTSNTTPAPRQIEAPQ